MIRGQKLNIFLLMVIAGLVAANIALRADPGRRNIDVFPNMVRSVAYDSFDRNPNFRDGKTLQLPVAGTVLYHQKPLHYAATTQDAIRAGIELVNPYSATDPKAAARGAEVFANFCQACHGPEGKADGMVSQRGFPAPPSLLAPNARQLPDGRIFHIISLGQNNMPPYGSLIEPGDRWKAVLYVRQLQKNAR